MMNNVNAKTYSYVNLHLVTDAIIKTVTTKDGRKVYAMSFKATTDAGTTVEFTQFASINGIDTSAVLNRAPYLYAGRNITVKTSKGITSTVVENTTYNNITGWVANMDLKTLDMKKAEARKGLFRI